MKLNRKVTAVIFAAIVLLAGLMVYVQLESIETLVLEVAFSVIPEMGEQYLEDVDLAFEINTYLEKFPRYQIQQGYYVKQGLNKIAIIDLLVNFTLKIDVLPLNGLTPWKSINLEFSSLLERKVRIFVERGNVTLGEKATVVIDAHLVVWYKDQPPKIDKTLHRVFTVDVPKE